MKKITATALFKIKDGKLDEFKKLIPEFISVTKEKEPGNLTYDWYLNEVKMECAVVEVYADSQALLAHAGNVGGLLEKAGALADLSLEVYGNPDEKLQEVLNDMGVVSYGFYAGR